MKKHRPSTDTKLQTVVQVLEQNFRVLKQKPWGMVEQNAASNVSVEIAACAILGKKLSA